MYPKIIETSIDTAFKLFNSSETQKYNHFAFLFERNKMISVGQNNMKDISAKALYFANMFKVRKLKKYSFIHAEIDCIKKLWGRKYISGREKLVVIRIGKSGKLFNSKPCDSCNKILSCLGLDKIWYSIDNGFDYLK